MWLFIMTNYSHNIIKYRYLNYYYEVSKFFLLLWDIRLSQILQYYMKWCIDNIAFVITFWEEHVIYGTQIPWIQVNLQSNLNNLNCSIYNY